MPTSAIPYSRLNDNATLRLICLPYAGGGSAVFHRWRNSMPAQVDLVPLCLPGHDGRLAEPPRTDLRTLAAELAGDLLPALDRSFVLLGHSLGAWVAFELARELRRRNAWLPELLVISGARAPGVQSPASPLYTLPDEELVAAMQSRYGGIPDVILNNRELLELLLPVLRADIQMVETYQSAAEPPLNIEFLVLGGSEDAAVSAAQLSEWRQHTARTCSIRQYPGGHFFLFRGDEQQSPSSGSHPSPALQTVLDSINRLTGVK